MEAQNQQQGLLPGTPVPIRYWGPASLRIQVTETSLRTVVVRGPGRSVAALWGACHNRRFSGYQHLVIMSTFQLLGTGLLALSDLKIIFNFCYL